MSNQSTAAVHITGVFARAAATGLVGAALSAERHSVAMRRVGLAFAAGLGTAAGLAAAGILQLPKGDELQSPRGSDDEHSTQSPDSTESTGGTPAPVSLPPAAAVTLGLATFALAAGVSEAGLRTQLRLERWADDAFGRPRLVVGFVTGAAAFALDLADDWTTRRAATPTSVPS